MAAEAVGNDMSLQSPALGGLGSEWAGRWARSGSFARYVMALTSNLAASTASGGNAATCGGSTQGPADQCRRHRGNASASLTTTEAAVRQVFDWYDAGWRRYSSRRRRQRARRQHDDSRAADVTVLHRICRRRRAGRSASAAPLRADGVFRDFRNLYSQRTDLTTGRVTDASGNTFDLNVVENTDRTRAPVCRSDDAGQLRLRIAGFASAATTRCRARMATSRAKRSTAPSGASVNHYPEYRVASWNYPRATSRSTSAIARGCGEPTTCRCARRPDR